MQILKTPVKVSIRGAVDTGIPYRAVVTDKETLKIEQQIKGNWHHTGAEWGLSDTLPKSLICGLWIDFGQGWLVEPNPELAVEVACLMLDLYQQKVCNSIHHNSTEGRFE